MLVWFVVTAAAVFMLWRLLDPRERYPTEPPAAQVFRRFTRAELARYDGADGGSVFLAVRGRVYDVSSARAFYGPGGPYSSFAGRDASRGLALNSFDATVLAPIDGPADDLQDLTDEQRATLDGWAAFFGEKYMQCGDLVP